MTEKPEALRLAEQLEAIGLRGPVAAELRRLHASCEDYAQHKQRQDQRILKLYAQRDALLEALQALYDEQQGPPLIRHQAAWEAAMQKARAAIKKAEEA